MGVAGEILGHIIMAGHASIGAHVTGGIDRNSRFRTGCLLVFAGSHPGLPNTGQQRDQRHTQEHTSHSIPQRDRSLRVVSADLFAS